MAASTGNKGGRGGAGLYEINITPFVDVMLVLLILFMISTPALVYKGMRVSLPKVVKAEDISHVTLNIAIEPSGAITLDGKSLTIDELKGIYNGLSNSKVASDAILSADANVPHGKVMAIVDALRQIGIEQIGFGVLPKPAAAKAKAE